MKAFTVLLSVISLVYCKTLVAHPRAYNNAKCVNMWDEGCINGQLNGAGGDDYYLNGGGFNPGKRCVNVRDEGCFNRQQNGAGAGGEYYHLGGGLKAGKRCVNMWDEGCINGQLSGAGGDDYYLGGGFNPGKRSLQEFFMMMQNTHPNKIEVM